MPCIHGLDEVNCPNCRILKSTLPINSLKNIKTPTLKIASPFFKGDNRLEEKLSQEVTARNLNLDRPSLNLISKPPLITDIPRFENKIFLKRARELDISKEDNFGFSKKIALESPEWQFEEED